MGAFKIVELDRVASSAAAEREVVTVAAGFQSLTLICLSSVTEILWDLQASIRAAGNLGHVRILPFPSEAAACKSLVGMLPMLIDATKFEQQAAYFTHLKSESHGKESVVALLKEQFGVDQNAAVLLVDHFGTLARFLEYGGSFSFFDLLSICPINSDTASWLDGRFARLAGRNEGAPPNDR